MAALRYICLLRSVNVGGHGVISMAELKARFESFGLVDVSTYIQSGNVLFRSGEADPDTLAGQIEKQLESSLGYRTKVFVLTREDLIEAAAHNPFEPERLEKEQQCHLMFLSAEPSEANKERLMVLQGDEYRFAFHGKVLYYAYDKAWAGSRRNINFEKVLGVIGTSRTWKVVDKLIELASDQPAASRSA